MLFLLFGLQPLDCCVAQSSVKTPRSWRSDCPLASQHLSEECAVLLRTVSKARDPHLDSEDWRIRSSGLALAIWHPSLKARKQKEAKHTK